MCAASSPRQKSLFCFFKKKKLNERFFKVLYNFHKVHIPDFIYLIMAPFAPILIWPLPFSHWQPLVCSLYL